MFPVLCINNCPNGILTKADNDFSVVHIDYEKGLKYCEYDCNKCSEVCPSGAIKRQSLDQKQNTSIAMSVANEYECIECKMCMEVCPRTISGSYDIRNRLNLFKEFYYAKSDITTAITIAKNTISTTTGMLATRGWGIL